MPKRRPCAVQPTLPCLRRYQHFLESVLEVADEYQEVADLLLRHATLSATNADLKEHQRRCSELAEKVRAELQIYVKAKTDEILNLNNTSECMRTELSLPQPQQMLLPACCAVGPCMHPSRTRCLRPVMQGRSVHQERVHTSLSLSRTFLPAGACLRTHTLTARCCAALCALPPSLAALRCAAQSRG